MKILVINCGSSSLKFQLIETGKKSDNILAKGVVDGLGLKSCRFTFSSKTKNIGQTMPIKNHKEAVNLVLKALLKSGVIGKFSEISAVGHRAVHGGDKYSKAVKIDKKVMKVLEHFSRFVPLHNPANIAGIKACQEILKRVPQVAVFDTAYYSTLPEKAYLYGLPMKYAEKYGIRRYGFHGTSHKYVIGEALKILKNKKAKIVSCHLGNGSSVTASVGGKAIDTSMGFSPLEGVMMGTRSGSIDPAIAPYLDKECDMTPSQVWDFLNHDCGLKGFSGISSDMREIYKESLKGNRQAKLTIETLAYQIAKYVGSYAASMGGIDALVFTGGIGENAFYVRDLVCGYLKFLKFKTLVIKTNEEMQIVNETEKVLKSK